MPLIINNRALPTRTRLWGGRSANSRIKEISLPKAISVFPPPLWLQCGPSTVHYNENGSYLRQCFNKLLTTTQRGLISNQEGVWGNSGGRGVEAKSHHALQNNDDFLSDQFNNDKPSFKVSTVWRNDHYEEMTIEEVVNCKLTSLLRAFEDDLGC